MKRLLTLTIAIFLLAAPAFAQHHMDAAELQVALKKLTVLGSALYVAAHPDDENTAFIAWASNERLVRAGYLSVTRGDGGQNLIGDEKGDLLGVIRTQELLAARRIDRGEQFFTRAIDFGYSKTPQETLSIWGRDAILADVVYVIRRFRPDIIVTRFPTTGEGGHGHHTASAILALEAFRAAADPTRFPEQLTTVSPWQPKRIFWNRFSFQPIDPNDPAVAKSLRVDIGTFNPLLGRAYTEIAAESRSMHKSQGFGSAERRGRILNYFDLLDGAPASTDLFDGIDLTWSRFPGGERVGNLLQQAANEFDPKTPSKSIPLLLQAWNEMDRLGATEAWNPRVNPYLEAKRAELLEVIRNAAGISIDVAASASSIVPGGEIPISVTVVNRSDYPFILSTVASLYANPGKAPGKKLENNVPIKTDVSIKLPSDYPLSQPYWLRQPPTKGAFAIPDPALAGRAENPPAIPLVVSLQDPTMHTLIFSVPVIYRWTDPVQGEKTRPVDVVPQLTANFEEGVYVFPDAKPKTVRVTVENFGAATDAAVRLRVPAGWKVTPESAPLKFAAKGERASASFTVTPTTAESSGAITAEIGSEPTYSLVNIDYEHIPAQRVFRTATAPGVRADIKKRGSRIGYVMGSGDEVPRALRQIGYEVVLLSDADLAGADLKPFDAIVTGIRAYNTRDALKHAQSRLLDYVANGGTLVVQYNTTGDLKLTALGPHPFKLSRDRVTVEDAPVRFVDPAHPLLNAPNKITAADFGGWVQERGLYFTSEWDPKYATVLATNDPTEPEKAGGQLYARHGKGVFIYTSYAWWRQLPAGVPGAYKLFANLVSAK